MAGAETLDGFLVGKASLAASAEGFCLSIVRWSPERTASSRSSPKIRRMAVSSRRKNVHDLAAYREFAGIMDTSVRW
jgi:hypothetical protein